MDEAICSEKLALVSQLLPLNGQQPETHSTWTKFELQPTSGASEGSRRLLPSCLSSEWLSLMWLPFIPVTKSVKHMCACTHLSKCQHGAPCAVCVHAHARFSMHMASLFSLKPLQYTGSSSPCTRSSTKPSLYFM